MSFSFKRVVKGFLLRGEASDPTDNLEGSIWHNSATGSKTFKAYINSAVRTFIFGTTDDDSKKLYVDTSSSSTNTTTTLASSSTVDRTLTLPDSSTTLVGVNTTQTLTNKLLADGSVEFRGDFDPTSRLKFNLDNVDTGSTVTISPNSTANRTLSLPDIDDTLASETYVNNAVAGKDDASEITYTPAVLTDWNGDADPGNTNNALDQLAERVDDNETNISTNTGNISTNAGNISSNDTDISNLQGAVGASTEAAINYSSNNYIVDATDTVTAVGALDAQVGVNASGISTNAGNISTNATNHTNHLNDTTDAHDASAISVSPSGDLTSTDVQSALTELQGDIDAIEADYLTSNNTVNVSNKTFTDATTFQSDLEVQGKPILDSANDATSGSNVTLATITKGVVRLTSGTLVSVDTIPAGTDAQLLVLTNAAGVDITINTSGNIVTGTGSPVDLVDTSSFLFVYDSTSVKWRLIGGTGSGGAGGGLSEISTSITSATTGTFTTNIAGVPIIVAQFWDDSTSKFNEVSPASLTIDINSTGTSIDYDTTGLTFDTNDFLKLTAFYNESISTTNVDSGWILVSAANDTLKGASVAGYHEIDLPSGFTDDPETLFATIDDGSNRFPADQASRIILSNSGAQYRVAIDLTGLTGTDLFRIRARA